MPELSGDRPPAIARALSPTTGVADDRSPLAVGPHSGGTRLAGDQRFIETCADRPDAENDPCMLTILATFPLKPLERSSP